MVRLSVGCQHLPLQSGAMDRSSGSPNRVWVDFPSLLPPPSRRGQSTPRLLLFNLQSAWQRRVCPSVHSRPRRIRPQSSDPPYTRRRPTDDPAGLLILSPLTPPRRPTLHAQSSASPQQRHLHQPMRRARTQFPHPTPPSPHKNPVARTASQSSSCTVTTTGWMSQADTPLRSASKKKKSEFWPTPRKRSAAMIKVPPRWSSLIELATTSTLTDGRTSTRSSFPKWKKSINARGRRELE